MKNLLVAMFAMALFPMNAHAADTTKKLTAPETLQMIEDRVDYLLSDSKGPSFRKNVEKTFDVIQDGADYLANQFGGTNEDVLKIDTEDLRILSQLDQKRLATDPRVETVLADIKSRTGKLLESDQFSNVRVLLNAIQAKIDEYNTQMNIVKSIKPEPKAKPTKAVAKGKSKPAPKLSKAEQKKLNDERIAKEKALAEQRRKENHAREVVGVSKNNVPAPVPNKNGMLDKLLALVRDVEKSRAQCGTLVAGADGKAESVEDRLALYEMLWGTHRDAITDATELKTADDTLKFIADLKDRAHKFPATCKKEMNSADARITTSKYLPHALSQKVGFLDVRNHWSQELQSAKAGYNQASTHMSKASGELDKGLSRVVSTPFEPAAPALPRQTSGN